MKKQERILIYFFIIAIIIVSLYSYNKIHNKNKELSVLAAKLDELKISNENDNKQIRELEEKLKDCENYRANIGIFDVLIKEDRKIEEMHPWLATEAWDRIVIAPIDTDEKYVFINEPKILKSMIDFLFIDYETYESQSGFNPDIPRYSYTFIKGEKQYEIFVEERGIVNIDGKYYKANLNIHKLGDAFISNPIWNKPGNVETKIANAGVILSQIGSTYSTWRFTVLADKISEGVMLDSIPKDLGELMGSYTVYSYGDEIKLQTYNSYLFIEDGMNKYWYKLDDAAFHVHMILFGMG